MSLGYGGSEACDWGVLMSEGRGTILVVDDDSVLRRLLATVLKLRGFDVLVAEDGVQALEVLQHEDHVDLVLADIIMPQMDGWTLLERLKEHHPSVPVILLTLIEEAKPTSLALKRWAPRRACSNPSIPSA